MGTPKYEKADWIQLKTNNAPSHRANASIAYDEVRANVVLFGGFNASQGSYSDTWIFDGCNWAEVDPTR
ncbi:MAG: Kelch repeat-containing protein, partial [Ferrimicrobium sp.]